MQSSRSTTTSRAVLGGSGRRFWRPASSPHHPPATRLPKLKGSKGYTKGNKHSSELQHSARIQPHPTSLPLPNELILLVLACLPTAELAPFRLVSRHTQDLANRIFVRRYAQSVLDLDRLHTLAEHEYRILEGRYGEDMRRYARFLGNASMTDVTEAGWYTSPPAELRTVCECLCLLFRSTPLGGTSLSVQTARAALTASRRASATSLSSPVGEEVTAAATTAAPAGDAEGPLLDPATGGPRMDWTTIKRMMSKYNFKRWLTTLPTSAATIPLAAVRQVERIIATDATITYERLEEVSRPGYHLLILVAACLQIVPMLHALQGKREYRDTLGDALARTQAFLSAVSPVVPEDADAEVEVMDAIEQLCLEARE